MKDDSTNIIEIVTWKKQEVESKSDLGSWVKAAIGEHSQNSQKTVLINHAESGGLHGLNQVLGDPFQSTAVKVITSWGLSHMQRQRWSDGTQGYEVERREHRKPFFQEWWQDQRCPGNLSQEPNLAKGH